MTKYEWETELKKNIHRLPKSEQDKALEYYNELFMDKAESGRSETQIIAEFGNPCDVADKILAEYQYDLRAPEPVETPAPVKDRPTEPPQPSEEKASKLSPQAEPPKKKETVVDSVGNFVGGAFTLIFRILGGIVSAFVWLAVSVLLLVGFSMLIGGAAYAVIALFAYSANVPAMFAVIGVGLVAAGIGLIISLNCKLLCKTATQITRNLVGKR